jgi:nucleosome binding factor SPN SPT16 subunit
MADIVYQKTVHIKAIRKFRSEDAAAPWQLFDANDSSPQESHGSVSEYNASSDDMSSSSTSSVYIEDTGINDSNSDGSSISSHRDWKEDAHQSTDNTIVWSFSATHIGETCEMSEI